MQTLLTFDIFICSQEQRQETVSHSHGYLGLQNSTISKHGEISHSDK